TGERLESAVGLRNRFQAAVAHAFSYTNPLPQLPPQKLRCARRPFLFRIKFDSRAGPFILNRKHYG
ncbi:MAG: hypothetical protein ABSA45_07860, partial [Verrucomicrobiota bacterium]